MAIRKLKGVYMNNFAAHNVDVSGNKNMKIRLLKYL